MNYTALCERITNRIITQLETGDHNTTIRPLWHRNPTSWFPTNATTGKPYGGVNVVILADTADEHDYDTALWATYKQWQSQDAQVRKGERGTRLIKWVTKKSEPDSANTDADKQQRLLPVTFTVFNASQVDNWQPPITEFAHTPIERAERWIANTGAAINHQGNRAYYRPSSDQITMPEPTQFEDRIDYYAVTCHELIHWTAHPTRLDRPSATRDTDEYAFEELIAELGAAFTCARLGLSNEPRVDHADYLAYYIALLKTDPAILVKAASRAQRATEHLESLQPPEPNDHP